MGAPLIFLDCETTGLDPYRHDIWEVAAVRRDVDGTEREYHAFVDHDVSQADALPDSFRLDHVARYQAEVALPPGVMVRQLADFIGVTEDYGKRAHIVGAVPSFDTERLGLLFDAFSVPVPWHHHLIDVEVLAAGYLVGYAHGSFDASGQTEVAAEDSRRAHLEASPPWDSGRLSSLVGVDPDDFERHTALGDVRWAMAIYDAVMGGPS